jgi:hypothetical protein
VARAEQTGAATATDCLSVGDRVLAPAAGAHHHKRGLRTHAVSSGSGWKA